jgi:quinolinate synthase
MPNIISDLPFTPEIERATAPLYERVKDVVSRIEWPGYAPIIHEINRLKKEKNAVILAHNYQSAQIFHTVADVVGDSLALARDAAKVDADIIVMCGVHFMAETAKLLNPKKKVLIPDVKAGCSLADSITGADVRLLREKFPGVPVVTYVNTSAEVKAETDICCTSGNAVQIVESLGVPEVLFIPDQYLANYVATQTKVKIHTWHGSCEVHERFTAEDIRFFRKNNPGAVVLAHPECPPAVLAEADYVGSTAKMQDYVETKKPPRVILITECSMSDNLQAANPTTQFLRPCNLCPHMQRITLPKILAALQTEQPEVLIDEALAVRARLSVERMLAVK